AFGKRLDPVAFQVSDSAMSQLHLPWPSSHLLLWLACFEDVQSAGPAGLNFRGEVPRTSCAFARDCSRKGRRPLRAGGYIFPSYLDARLQGRQRRRVADSAKDELESLLETAVLNTSLQLWPHLPTLAEYSRRSRVVEEIGEAEGSWIAISHGLASGPGLVYQNNKRPRELLAFLQRHPELSLGLPDQSADLVFFSSSWLPDFASQLSAKAGHAQHILVHGRRQRALETWLQDHSDWKLMEQSSLGSGFAVLGKVRTPSPNCTESAWDLGTAQVLAGQLLDVQHDHPGLLGANWRVNMGAVRALKRRLQTSLRHCPSLDVRAALHILALFRSGKQGLITSLIKLAEEDIETAAIADEKMAD
ncbi:unnamed protein product, partial [Effrenium voratum]